MFPVDSVAAGSPETQAHTSAAYKLRPILDVNSTFALGKEHRRIPQARCHMDGPRVGEH